MKGLIKNIIWYLKTIPIKKINTPTLIEYENEFAICDKINENSWQITFFYEEEIASDKMKDIFINIPNYRVKKVYL